MARKLRLPIAALVGIAALATTASAQAGCVSGAKQTFAQFGDANWYSLIPDGGFEGTKGAWTASSGASIVSGNETYFLNKSADAYSMRLSQAASVVSPGFCIQSNTPLVRYVAKTSSGSTAVLRTDAILSNGLAVTVSRMSGTSTWRPTPQIQLWVNYLAALAPSGTATINLRITAETGTWQIDDVYLDPFKKV